MVRICSKDIKCVAYIIFVVDGRETHLKVFVLTRNEIIGNGKPHKTERDRIEPEKNRAKTMKRIRSVSKFMS